MEQFFIIAIAHLGAVISPDPDFALITRQSFRYGRKIAIYTSIGIGFGILFHIGYCIGLEFIFQKFDYIKEYLTIICCLYLLYMGLGSLLSSSNNLIFDNKSNSYQIGKRSFSGFFIGLITNVLNIKATLLFLGLYSFIDDSSLYIKLFYGIWMSVVTGLWFVFLSTFLTNATFKRLYAKYYVFIDKIMGFVLIYIAIKLYLNLYQ